MHKLVLNSCVSAILFLILICAGSARAVEPLHAKPGLRFEYSVSSSIEQKTSAFRIEQSVPGKQLVFTLPGQQIGFIEWFDVGTSILHDPKQPSPTTMKPGPGRPPNAMVLRGPDHWPQPSILTFYVSEPAYYLQEIATFPQRLVELANSQRIKNSPLPKLARFDYAGTSGEFKIIEQSDGSFDASGLKNLGAISPVTYRGIISFTVHEKREPVFEGAPEPGSFEISLDRNSGILLSLKTVLHIPKRAAMVTEVRTVVLNSVAKADIELMQKAAARFETFDVAYQSGRMDSAMRVSELNSAKTPFDDVIADRVLRLRQDGPLLGQSLPELMFSDVRGIEGETAAIRVKKLTEMMKGKPVLFDFWATWCGPCIAGMKKTLAAGRDKSGPLVVTATLINEKNPISKVEDFMSSKYETIHHEPFRGIVAVIENPAAYKKVVPHAIPHYVVLDRQGIVRYQGSGDTAGPVAIKVVKALAAASVSGE